METKGLVEYDICNYKKPSMFVIFPKCTFKCDKECKRPVCQNSSLANEPIVDITKEQIVERYLANPLTHAFVFGGLEPFDSWNSLTPLINCIRNKYDCKDDIVIYTGYTKEELKNGTNVQSDAYRYIGKTFPNIIIKYGRFVPDCEFHFDPVLGVELASPNQYAEKLKQEEFYENHN